ncbi:MAG: hypothetical protein O3C21_12215, partial [Verrucomicrobia bacterium]|nr:hypothetical protein [Verrucomicrobiota bacterium]
GMSPPFGAGMPDMPGAMPEMPVGDEMPDLDEIPELGGMPDFDSMPVGPEVQPPDRQPSSLEQKRKILRTEMDKLAQSDQQQLRLALRQVWSDQKVEEARDAYRQAGQRYQQALYKAMLTQNNNVRPFLERLINAGLHVPFGKIVEPYEQVARLFEVPSHLLESHKAEISAAYSVAKHAPEVLAIRLQLEKSSSDRRDEFNQLLRDALRSALLIALPEINDWVTMPSELSA